MNSTEKAVVTFPADADRNMRIVSTSERSVAPVDDNEQIMKPSSEKAMVQMSLKQQSRSVTLTKKQQHTFEPLSNVPYANLMKPSKLGMAMQERQRAKAEDYNNNWRDPKALDAADGEIADKLSPIKEIDESELNTITSSLDLIDLNSSKESATQSQGRPQMINGSTNHISQPYTQSQATCNTSVSLNLNLNIQCTGPSILHLYLPSFENQTNSKQ